MQAAFILYGCVIIGIVAAWIILRKRFPADDQAEREEIARSLEEMKLREAFESSQKWYEYGI